MIRLTLILCASLFAVMFLLGEDRGQKRLGLAGAYAIATDLPAPAPVPEIRVVDTSEPAPVTEVTQAVYTPAQPVVSATLAASPTEATIGATIGGTDIRRVVANSANVRGGPSTGDAVVGRLARNEEVLVIADAGDGWVQIRIEGDGVDGFIAARLLSAAGE